MRASSILPARSEDFGIYRTKIVVVVPIVICNDTSLQSDSLPVLDDSFQRQILGVINDPRDRPFSNAELLGQLRMAHIHRFHLLLKLSDEIKRDSMNEVFGARRGPMSA